MKNKTKNELIDLIEELQNKITELENDVDYWQDEYSKVDEQLDEVNITIEDMKIKNGIKNKDNFIWRLKLDNLYSNELKDFIEEYLKFFND